MSEWKSCIGNIYEVVRKCMCGREWIVYAEDPEHVTRRRDLCCTYKYSRRVRYRLIDDAPEWAVKELYINDLAEVNSGYDIRDEEIVLGR